MIREQERYFLPLQLFLDFTSILLAFFIAAGLSLYLFPQINEIPVVPSLPFFNYFRLPPAWFYYFNLVPVMFVFPLIFLVLFKNYEHSGLRKPSFVVRRTGLSCLFTAVVFFSFVAVYSFLKNDIRFFSIYIVLLWPLLVGSRVIISRLIKLEHKKSNFIRFVLITGTNETARQAARHFDMHPEWGVRIVGFLTDRHDEIGKRYNNYDVIGLIENMDAVIESNIVDCIFFAGGIDDFKEIRNLTNCCRKRGIDLAYTTSVLDRKPGDVFAECFDGFSFILLKSVSHSPEKLFLKRVIDFTVSGILIVMCLPLWFILPILIKRDSPGPAYFCQERIGKNGRRFIMYKFRSMVNGAEGIQTHINHLNEMDGPVFKIREDPRLTRMGKFLRRTSLDELPQLFNVFKGEMSLVGPRPPVIQEVVQYTPWQRKRLSVKQGVTCLWQVTGRNEIKFDEWMKLDLQYIDNWSLTLDLKIILRTVHSVLSRRGAQ